MRKNSTEQSYDEAAYNAQRSERYNNSPGTLYGFDCPTCQNRGNFMYFEGHYELYRECECMSVRRSMRRLERSGMKELTDSCTFKNFRADSRWQKDAKKMVETYVDANEGQWLYIGGQVGSGKTHLCVAAATTFMMRGLEARYMLWRDEIVKIKACVTDEYAYDRLVRPLKTVRVLYIDDLFKTERDRLPSTADINLAFEILNYRYINKGLITLLSSERLMDELLEVDEAVGSRIYERTKGFCLEIPSDPDKNYRMRRAKT